MNLFTRQMAYLGPASQNTLRQSTVAIIGLGALGSTVAHLLTRMGIGNLILCDDDTIQDHNLSRQHLYTTADIGKPKVEVAKWRLQEINPDCNIIIFNERISPDNIHKISARIIVDGTDNHASRRIIDQYCKEQSIPWVHGASIEDMGTVVFFSQNLHYNDIYSPNAKDQHCDVSGVIVTATTLTATIQSSIVIDFLLQKEIPKMMYRISGSHVDEISL